MTCKEVISFMMAYLDRELPDEARAEFDAHLNVCRSCRDFMSNYRRTVELGKEAFSDPAAPAAGTVPPDLIKAIKATLLPKP